MFLHFIKPQGLTSHSIIILIRYLIYIYIYMSVRTINPPEKFKFYKNRFHEKNVAVLFLFWFM